MYSSDMEAQKWEININNNTLIVPDRPVEERKESFQEDLSGIDREKKIRA